MSETVHLATGDVLGLTGQGAGSRRSYYSITLLRAARHFSISAREREVTVDKPWDSQLTSCVLGTIMFSVAFVEAFVNEQYQDVYDLEWPSGPGPSPEAQAAIRDWWQRSSQGRQGQVLDKWQQLLKLWGQPPLDKGKQPCQDVATLVALRNYFVHYKPVTSRPGQAEHKLSSRTVNRFPGNRHLSNSANPWFPDQMIGAGCATWAYERTLDFGNLMAERLGLLVSAPLRYRPGPVHPTANPNSKGISLKKEAPGD